MTGARPGVSFVLPVLNGRRWLRPVIEGILAQQDGRPFEIIAIDDGSTDGSEQLLRAWQDAGALRVIRGEGRGAAAAINAGVRDARHPFVCQVDQDVILAPGWLAPLMEALEDPEVAAAQGHYRTAPDAGFWARAMGRDLEQRYARIPSRYVDHVCTGNTAYRATALRQVGLLDPDLGYGYDNDLSYRLGRLGYRLVFCRDAISLHRWREGVRGYLSQQYGVAYGRLDVVVRHPLRARGDDVSGTVMMLHAPAMLAALCAALWAVCAASAPAAYVALVLVAVLAAERTAAGVRVWRRTSDAAAPWFAVAHLARDCAWAAAIVVWSMRRLSRIDERPAHSMGRSATTPMTRDVEIADSIRPGTLLAIVPAFNEAANLPRVVADLRRVVPQCDVLVVNDGSTDSTASVLPGLPVRWLEMSHRVGVGGAVRAGIRYGLRHRYDYVVRIDGDGQHRARDIVRLLAPVTSGRADVTMGSRFLGRGRLSARDPGQGPLSSGLRRTSQALLATCLTLLTGRRVTDPTSGSWLFGPRALRLLARHHPTGYAEPELVLLLHRNGVRVVEVPIRTRRRLSGRTSLTAPRALQAFARTLLAVVVVPLRRVVEGRTGD